MSLDKTEEYNFRLLLLRISTKSLIHMLIFEEDDRQAAIIRQEIRARGGN
jgi:hypothetical protein